MGRDRFRVKGPDDEFVTAGDDIEEVIRNLEEQSGLADPEQLVDDYEF